MKLSKRGEYALRSLINLGIAAEVGRSLVQATELAENEQMPIRFLEAILQALKDGGFVVSERGKFGGYRLAKPANAVPIGQVVRHIDGPLAPIGCVSQSAYEKCSCPDEEHCGLRMLMLDVRNAIAGILDRYTLADVVDVTLRKLRRDGLPLPFSSPPRYGRAARVPANIPAATSAAASAAVKAPRRPPTDGIVDQLLGHYSI